MMKFIAYLICYCIYPFSFLFPRSKRKWAFGSFRGAFNDNAKYLFIHVSEMVPEIHCAWLSINMNTVQEIRSKGLKAYHILSPRGAWFALTSKFWFFNAYSSDIMFCLSGGAKLVNLWHGLPLKRIEFDITSGLLAERYVKKTLRERYYHPEVFQRPDYIVSSTELFSEIFARSFRISRDQCLDFGLARNEILTWTEEKRMAFVERYEPAGSLELIAELKHYARVLIYMPTWRESQRELFVQSFDLNRMNQILKAHNSLLLLKPHANTIVDAAAFVNYSNVKLIDAKMDVYPILPFTDVLITDYSSVMYDYILMENKDVILYLYDYEEYVKERDFCFPFDESVVGKKVWDFEELCNCIGAGNYCIDESQRRMIIDKFWGKTMSASPSQRLASLWNDIK